MVAPGSLLAFRVFDNIGGVLPFFCSHFFTQSALFSILRIVVAVPFFRWRFWIFLAVPCFMFYQVPGKQLSMICGFSFFWCKKCPIMSTTILATVEQAKAA